MTPTLVTIPFSHYCEKARWALQRASIEHVEAAHLPMLSRLGTLRRGRWSTVPLLMTDQGPIPDSTAILQWIARRGGDFDPYPEAVAAEALEWEERFDQRLGPHARRVAFSWTLPNRALILSMARDARVPRIEKAIARATIPVLRGLLRRGLKIDEAGVARSLARIDEVFGQVADRLADGRRFLCGDRFTAADLTFAALAAPVLLPDHYGASLPRLDQLAADGQAVVERLRSHPAGGFAQEIYRSERNP
jgi:glutathione S-transferase